MARASLIIVIHAPGNPRNLRQTLGSVSVSAARARQDGVRCSIVVSIEAGCAVARETLQSWQEPHRVVRRSAGRDAAAAKMAIVRDARESFVAFVESGDLVSPEWFRAALAFAREKGRSHLVLHPEATVLFGTLGKAPLGGMLGPGPAFVKLVRHVDQESHEFDFDALKCRDPWGPQWLTARKNVLSVPLSARVPGFGHESWHWSCEAVVAGLVHRVVPATVHFAREGSEHFKMLERGPEGLPVLPSEYFMRRFRAPRLATGQRKPLGSWFQREWIETSRSEPRLAISRPELDRIEEVTYRDTQEKELAIAAGKVAAEIGRGADCLFVVHQLRRGGSELEALLHVRAIRKSKPRARIVMMTTEPVQSDWLERLPEDVKVVDFARETFQSFSRAESARILLQALLLSAPKVIHVKHAWQAWEAYRLHSLALKHASRLFASLYCVDFSEDGRPMSYGFSHLSECFPHLDGIFCDNERMAEQVKEVTGSMRTHVLRFPVVSSSARRPTPALRESRPLRILWASRIARQKRLELLIDVVSRLPNDRFEVFGEFSDPAICGSFRRALRRFPNLVYQGGFDGLDSIRTSDYDLYLYTSSWDGLPNILLEAGAHGLPVVASAVGGVPELITARTGYPVESAEDFVAAIEAVRARPAEAQARALELEKLVRERHNFSAFVKTIRNIPRYLEKR